MPRRLLALAISAATGFAGAAAISAFMTPQLPVAHGFGQGDGLTRYVVTAASGPATPEFVAALSRVPGVTNAQSLHGGNALVATRGLTLQQLRDLPGVGGVEFSAQARLLGTAITDPYWSYYGYNLQNTGSNSYHSGTAGFDVAAPTGWTGGTGAGLVVADLDSGYYTAHEDLQGALWTNPKESCSATTDTDGDGHVGDCHGWNFTTNSAAIDNGSGGEHGTSTAGVIGERLNNGKGTAGVAPSVQIMPVTIGSGSNVDVNLGIEAIYYAVDHGASVINASWGGAMGSTTLANLKAAIQYADQHGVVFVAAAGNDSGNRDTAPLYPASLGGNSAGSLPNVITVGNMDPNGTIDATSAYGATTVDLFAPGDLVPTTWNNDGGNLYMLVSGTSIAAPHVAAAAALYRAKLPTATAAQIKAAVNGDAVRVPAFAGRSVTGGMLSLARLAGAGTGTVAYTFSAMNQPVGTVSPRVDVAGTSGSGHYTVRIGLGMNYQGQTWALSGKSLALGGQPATTNDDGEATFDLGTLPDVGPQQLAPSVLLAAGRYALTVQMYKDGAALGQTIAAPMVVGAPPAPAPGGSAGPSSGGTPPTGSPAPSGSGTPSGSSTPSGSGTPGGGTPSGTDPSGSSTPPAGATTPPGSGGIPSAPTSDPSFPTPGATDPTGTGTGSGTGSGTGGTGSGTGGTGSGGSGTGPTSPSGGTTDPSAGGTPPSGSTPPPAGTPAPPTGSPSPGNPGPGGQQTYPPTGTFGLTSISPARVSTAGGTLVTVTGTAIPANPRILVAGTASATVTSSDATSVTFVSPALAAGTYDVTVFDSTGTQSSTLTQALQYVDPAAGSGTGGSSGTGGAGTGSGTGSGSGGSGSGAGSGGGSSAPATATGPNGERLVQSSRYASLTDSFWSPTCGTTCSGTVI